MSKVFRPYGPKQMFLMPVALQEWLPPDHLVYFIDVVVEHVELSAIMKRYEAEERASRKIEKRLHEDIAFKVLAANNTPDFKTIAS